MQRNFDSDKKFAEFLGVATGTAEGYRLGRTSLSLSSFQKLHSLNPTLRPTKITDSSWGQRKGAAILWQRRKAITSAPPVPRSRNPDVSPKRTSAHSTGIGDVSVYDQLSPSKLLKAALDCHKSEFAEFVGRILGDGSPIIAPSYYATEIESQKRMQLLVSWLFNYSPKIGVGKGNYRIQLKRVCGHTLELLGIPLGRKSVTNPAVPSFIMDSHNPSVWVHFLRGLFDDEAYVSERGIEIGLAVRQSKGQSPTGSRILDNVSELLNRLGILHVRRRGQTYQVGKMQSICWFLRIPRMEFKKVQELQLFLLPGKKRKLLAALATARKELNACYAGLERGAPVV